MDKPTATPSNNDQLPKVNAKQKKHNCALMLIILGLLLITAVISYLIANKLAATKQLSKACTKEAKLCPDGSSVGRSGPNCEFTPCPTDPTANWKTYTNSVFTFKYPNNADKFKLTNTKSNEDVTIGYTNPQEKQSGIITDGYNFSVEKTDYKDITKLKNITDEELSIQKRNCSQKTQFTPVTQTNISGNDAYSFSIINCTFQNYTYNYVINNNNIYLITQMTAGDDQNLKEYTTITSQILSTFKFLDDTNDTSNWKTYTNEKYRYSINYPSTWTVDLSYAPSEFTIDNQGITPRLIIDFNNKYKETITSIKTKELSKIEIADNVTYQDKGEDEGGGTFINYYLINNDKIITFSSSYYPENTKTDIYKLDQILSTFKFLE